MNWILATLLVVVGGALMLPGIFRIQFARDAVPLRLPRTVGRLRPGQRSLVTGFVRGEPVLRDPLVGKVCLAWECRAFVLQETEVDGREHSEWVPVGEPVRESVDLAIEDESGDHSVVLRSGQGLSLGEFGPYSDDANFMGGHLTELHERMGIVNDPRSTRINVWRLDRLDQVTVACRPQGNPQSGWELHPINPALPLTVFAGSAGDAIKSVLAHIFGGLLIAGLGLMVVAGGVVFAVFRPV